MPFTGYITWVQHPFLSMAYQNRLLEILDFPAQVSTPWCFYNTEILNKQQISHVFACICSLKNIKISKTLKNHWFFNVFGSKIGPVLGCLGPVLGCLGPFLGCLGPVLGLSWACLGLSWACLGLSWANLGLSRASLGLSWACFALSLAVLGLSWLLLLS